MKTIQTKTHLLLVEERTVKTDDWIFDNDNIYQASIHDCDDIKNIIIASSPKLGDLPEFETLPKEKEYQQYLKDIAPVHPMSYIEWLNETLPPNTEDDVENL